MSIKLIACIDNANGLGKENKLLYSIPSDLTNFKRMTEGNILIMGMNTYESLPKKPLPNRTSIVISHLEDYVPNVKDGETIYVADSVESAIAIAETLQYNNDIFVVGGASVYKQFIDKGLVDTMYLTLVDETNDADAFFPERKDEEWTTRYLSSEMYHIDENGRKIAYKFGIFKKRNNVE